VKRLYADDSAATSVKVGYRQASYSEKSPLSNLCGLFLYPTRCEKGIIGFFLSGEAYE
jgi:hypothetical protein